MLKETALLKEHRLLGAKFINFHGWKMPLEFSGAVEEHLNVRKNAGLFDVSHMGEIRVRGKESLKFLEKYLTNNVSILKENQTQYNFLCNKEGGIIDDLILYCLKKDEDYLLCVNSARVSTDLAWLKPSDLSVEVYDESAKWAQMALQGPKAPELFKSILSFDILRQRPEKKAYKATPPENSHFVEEMKKNQFQCFSFFEEPVLVSATGYTGEKGFEFLISSKKADSLWRAILKQGKNKGSLPSGLAARDTLRMEMKYPLYGKDLNEKRDPHSAGFSWAVRKLGNFIGSSALSQIKKNLKKKWVGFQLLPEEKLLGVPRSGSRIFVKGKPVGEVTSGAKSPSLGKMIGLGYVPIEYSWPGQKIEIEIHQKALPAEVVLTPFVKGLKK